MKKKLLKGVMCLSLIGLLSVPQQANAIYYERPTKANINFGYENDNGVPFTSIDQEYYKEDYMKFKINEIKDITNEYDKRYIRYNNVDRIILIDYTYTNLQYKSMPMFIQPKIVFNNAVVSSADNREYIPTQLFNNDCDYLDKFSNHPNLRSDERGSWKVCYILHNRLDGIPRNTIDINFNNTGSGYDKVIWSIPVESLTK